MLTKIVFGYLLGIFIFVFAADVTVNLSLAMWAYHAGYEEFSPKVILERLWYAELIAFRVL